MSTGLAYALQPNDNLLSHWSADPRLAGDYISVDTEKLDTQIRSGDYFVTLATTLEVLSQRLAVEENPAAVDFERLANELLYLQNYYAIARKSPSDSKHRKTAY